MTEDLEPNKAESGDFAKLKSVSPGGGGRIARVTAVIGLGLGGGFFFVHRSKNEADTRLAHATSKETSEPPAVSVIPVTLSPGTQSLKLPGETASWNETAIYARVNGYVAKWFYDFGDT